MTQTVHQPRVAWDGARAFVQAAGSPRSEQFAARVLSRLGSEVYGQFADTRQRLLDRAGRDRRRPVRGRRRGRQVAGAPGGPAATDRPELTDGGRWT